jgi:hypothetical protein
MFSAETELGIPSQPLTTAPPLAQIFLTLFSRTIHSSRLNFGATMCMARVAVKWMLQLSR